MTLKDPRKGKTKTLQSFLVLAPSQNRNRIQNIINMYQNTNIKNYKTAYNIIYQLTFKGRNAVDNYNKLIAKYQDAEPMKGSTETITES
jgi:predicted transcriptional regulator